MNVTTWLKVELNKVEDYGEKMQVAKKVAKDFVDTLMTTEDPQLKLMYFKELMDRTEGKPKQYTETTAEVTLKGKELHELSTEEILQITK